MHDARLRANAKRSEEIRLQQRETGVTWMKQRGAVNRTSTNTLSELALAQLALSSFLWCFIYREKLSNWVASCSHFLSQTETAAHGVLLLYNPNNTSLAYQLILFGYESHWHPFLMPGPSFFSFHVNISRRVCFWLCPSSTLPFSSRS